MNGVSWLLLLLAGALFFAGCMLRRGLIEDDDHIDF